jgi:cysteine/O-acetylserine efflux protein
MNGGMLGGQLLPFLSYAFVTIFTPGPNNISSASMGMNFGYRSSLPYLLGIFSGVFGVMLLCGLLTESMVELLPSLESVLRIVGALYMLYLAYLLVRSTSVGPKSSGASAATYPRGVVLQLVNPKLLVFGITVYSGFLLEAVSWALELAGFALFLGALAFASVSLWALFGAGLNRLFRRYAFRLGFNLLMALLLCYSAASISGLI